MAEMELGGAPPIPGLGYGSPLSQHSLVRITDHGRETADATVATEVPVAFVYNGRSHVVMMSTPADLEDLAVGFTLSEQIVERRDEIAHVDVVRYSRGVEVQLSIPTRAADRLSERGSNRAIAARTGCGICGAEAIDAVMRAAPPVVSALTIAPAALWQAGDSLGRRQPLNHDVHTIHAAGWASPDGEVRVVREDVGRHNAVDKVLGALAREGTDARAGFLVVTSRASYELVQKAAVAGVPLLAAVSRPTSLAIRFAESCGVTLVGLLRGRSANVYSHVGRIREQA